MIFKATASDSSSKILSLDITTLWQTTKEKNSTLSLQVMFLSLISFPIFYDRSDEHLRSRFSRLQGRSRLLSNSQFSITIIENKREKKSPNLRRLCRSVILSRQMVWVSAVWFPLVQRQISGKSKTAPFLHPIYRSIINCTIIIIIIQQIICSLLIKDGIEIFANRLTIIINKYIR